MQLISVMKCNIDKGLQYFLFVICVTLCFFEEINVTARALPAGRYFTKKHEEDTKIHRESYN